MKITDHPRNVASLFIKAQSIKTSILSHFFSKFSKSHVLSNLFRPNKSSGFVFQFKLVIPLWLLCWKRVTWWLSPADFENLQNKRGNPSELCELNWTEMEH